MSVSMISQTVAKHPSKTVKYIFTSSIDNSPISGKGIFNDLVVEFGLIPNLFSTAFRSKSGIFISRGAEGV